MMIIFCRTMSACTTTPVADPDCGASPPEPGPCAASATLACEGLRLVWDLNA